MVFKALPLAFVLLLFEVELHMYAYQGIILLFRNWETGLVDMLKLAVHCIFLTFQWDSDFEFLYLAYKNTPPLTM